MGKVKPTMRTHRDKVMHSVVECFGDNKPFRFPRFKNRFESLITHLTLAMNNDQIQEEGKVLNRNTKVGSAAMEDLIECGDVDESAALNREGMPSEAGPSDAGASSQANLVGNKFCVI